MKQRINEYGQPIGQLLADWEQRAIPGEMRYIGKYTIVNRLSSEHIEGLFDAYSNSDPANWTYLSDEPPAAYEAFEQNIHSKIASTANMFYAVLDKETNQPLGIFSLMRIDPKNGVIEVGSVNFSDALRRTRISTEAHFLLASYVFDELQYRRYEWKCDSLNAPSIRTAERLGFTFEGTFRQAVIYKGRSRDTAWFSMLRDEWPDRKQAFERWLAEENFDQEGRQIRKLETFRNGG